MFCLFVPKWNGSNQFQIVMQLFCWSSPKFVPSLSNARIANHGLGPFRIAYEGFRWSYFSIEEVCAIFEVISILLLFVMFLFLTFCCTLRNDYAVSICSWLIYSLDTYVLNGNSSFLRQVYDACIFLCLFYGWTPVCLS